MLADSLAFSGFSVNDLDAARSFYADTLGLPVEVIPEGLSLQLATGGAVFLYPKDDHQPASFTVLNFPVEDIDEAVDALVAAGVEIEHHSYADEKGIARGRSVGRGPDIAWFRDPAGNTLSVLVGD